MEPLLVNLQAGGQEGSRVFTYVDQDEACQDFEAGQAATTLPGDAASPLFQKVLRERSWNVKVSQGIPKQVRAGTAFH